MRSATSLGTSLAVSSLGGATALLLAMVLGPIQSRIWNGPEAPPISRWVADAVAPSATVAVPAAKQDFPPAAYFAFGHWAVVIYAALLFAMRGHAMRHAPRLRFLVLTALTIAMIGDVLAYWASAQFGPALRVLGFWGVEVPALALAIAATTAAGAIGLRGSKAPRAAAGALVIVAPAALVLTASLRYMPHGLLGAIAAGLLANAALSTRTGAPNAEPAK